jgi:hypothetical protein
MKVPPTVICQPISCTLSLAVGFLVAMATAIVGNKNALAWD